VIVGIDGASECTGREAGDHLVRVHVGAGARSGLEDVYRELVVVRALLDLPGGPLDGRGEVGRQPAALPVLRCGAPLDEGQRAEEGPRETPADQIEIYFSILERKALTPNDFGSSLADVEDRLLGFDRYYESIATPFDWRFTKDDLAALMRKLDGDASARSVAA